MIPQRLHHQASLESAELVLLRGLPASFWPRPCQRLPLRKPLSSHTGAYNKARLALLLSVVEQPSDRLFEQLAAFLDGTVAAFPRRAFFFEERSDKPSL